MGQNTFASNVLQLLLSWLQSLMSGLWSLFSGAGGGSVLRWFSDSWKSLLIVFLVAGIALDIVVYLLRWRPFWWWFRKKRLIVDDEILEEAPVRPRRAVQPSTYVPRRETGAKKREDLFQEPDLFSVKAPARDSLYAPRRAPARAHAAPRKAAPHKTRSARH